MQRMAGVGRQYSSRPHPRPLWRPCPSSVSVPQAGVLSFSLALIIQVAALQLSPEQRENIMGMRRVLMHNLGLLLRRRQELVSSLTVRYLPRLSSHSQAPE